MAAGKGPAAACRRRREGARLTDSRTGSSGPAPGPSWASTPTSRTASTATGPLASRTSRPGSSMPTRPGRLPWAWPPSWSGGFQLRCLRGELGQAQGAAMPAVALSYPLGQLRAATVLHRLDCWRVAQALLGADRRIAALTCPDPGDVAVSSLPRPQPAPKTMRKPTAGSPLGDVTLKPSRRHSYSSLRHCRGHSPPSTARLRTRE